MWTESLPLISRQAIESAPVPRVSEIGRHFAELQSEDEILHTWLSVLAARHTVACPVDRSRNKPDSLSQHPDTGMLTILYNHETPQHDYVMGALAARYILATQARIDGVNFPAVTYEAGEAADKRAHDYYLAPQADINTHRDNLQTWVEESTACGSDFIHAIVSGSVIRQIGSFELTFMIDESLRAG